MTEKLWYNFSMEEIVKHLEKIKLLSHLDYEQLKDIAQFSKITKHHKSQLLFYEKDLSDEMFYIQSGSLKLYKVDRFDNEIFLYRVEQDSFIIDFSHFDLSYSFGHFSNAEFIEHSSVISINVKEFKKYYDKDPTIQKSIFKECTTILNRFQCVVNRDIVFDGIAKVAHMLVNDVDSFNKLKKHEIAYMLHIQPETLSRILKKLERNQIIMAQKNSIKILDLNALKEIYE